MEELFNDRFLSYVFGKNVFYSTAKGEECLFTMDISISQ